MKKIILILLVTYSIFCFAEKNSDPYEGYWIMPDNKVVIEIEKKGEEYVGYVRWLEDRVYPTGDKMEGQEQIDRNNPDINLRQRKVMGLQVVGGLHKDKDGDLVGGWVYDSWNGKLYHGSAKIKDPNTVSLRGAVDKWGILGYSMKIKRADKEFASI